MLSLLCALSLTLPPQGPAPAERPASLEPLGLAPAVRVDGADLSWDEVSDWFLRTFGESDLPSFVRRIAIHREASLQGCLPAPGEVQAEVDDLITQRVRGAFNGSHEDWLKELSDLGDTEEARRFAMLDSAAMDLELRALVRAGRDSEEASLRALFEDRFGPGGLSLVLDAIILRVSYPTRGPSQTREEQRAARAKAENEVRKTLLTHRARLENGEVPFAALVAQVSEDADSRARGGRLADFDSQALRPEATRALFDLAVGGVSEPILYDGRWHLFRVAERVQAEFEKERPALLQALKEGAVSAPESEDWIAALLARTKITPLAGDTGLDAPILEVAGQVLTGRDLGAYMLLHEGGALVQNFVADKLIEAEALSAGIEISDDAALSRVREDIELQAATETKGDLEAWEAMLRHKTGMTRATYERQAMQRARTELRAEALMSKGEPASEETLRRLWEQRYGPAGQRHTVRLLSLAVAPGDPTEPEAEREASYAKRREATLRQAEELRSRAAAGEDFAALCRTYSADGPSAKEGGRLDGYLHQQNWPEKIVETVSSLRRGSFSQPIDFDGIGFLLFEIVSVETHPYEEVVEALRTDLSEARPSIVRTAGWINQRVKAAKWTRLPGFWRASERHMARLLEKTRAAAIREASADDR